MSSIGKNSLIFRGYVVKKIEFNLNTLFVPKAGSSIPITPKLQRAITKIDKDKVIVGLNVSIDDKEGSPFFLKLNIEGLFELKNWELETNKTLIYNSATTILFPYLRSTVSNVTASANVGSYVLPIVNITAMFDNQEESENNE